MSSPQRPSLIRAATLTNYFDVARQLDLNPEPHLLAAGLSRTMLADPERRIPAAAAVRLLEDSARASGCDTFGLRMAEQRPGTRVIFMSGYTDGGALPGTIGSHPTAFIAKPFTLQLLAATLRRALDSG